MEIQSEEYQCINGLMSKIDPQGRLFKFPNVKEGEILKILKHLKPTKAAGIDNIPPRMIEDAAEELCWQCAA